MNGFQLKPNMLLGFTSSAASVDGGELNSSWQDWYRRGRTKNSSPAVGAGHWERWREDTVLMKRLGAQTCRVGVDWARIEPEFGSFDIPAIEHIKQELMLIHALGMLPVLTLHQYNNPIWFEKRGGWAVEDNIRHYLRFVEVIIRSVGHIVNEYITLDSPNIAAIRGYHTGAWPPGQKSPKSAMHVMSVMATAHIKAYQLIHRTRSSMGFEDSRVSFALAMRTLVTQNSNNPAQAAVCAVTDRFFQMDIARAMMTGKFTGGLKNLAELTPGTYCDFIGISYLSRSTMSVGGEVERKRAPKDDMGWEIYPPGLVMCARKLYEILPLPIYITANGASDLNDSFRSRFIYEHLYALCASELPIERYYCRSLLDGFEWVSGYSARFGLVHVDFDTMERSVKPSGNFYSRIIAEGGVSDELYNEFAAGQCYHYLSQEQLESLRGGAKKKKPKR